MIPIFKPVISQKGKNNVLKCLKTSWISSQGIFIKKFENALKEFHKMKYCVATSSCTTALHLAILSLNLKKNDEIICPALSFISPANMVILSNLKLVLVDINPKTLTIDENEIEKKITKKTKAILVVHQFGHAANMSKILKLKKKYNLKIIEDNAESIGGKFKKKLNGTMGDLSTLSFFANKIITTGEGGAVLTNNKNLYLKCLQMRDHGMSLKKRYFHKMLGFNYRMSELHAALGISQLNRIDNFIEKRKKIVSYYLNKIGNLPLKRPPFSSDSAWHLFVCQTEDEKTRKDLYRFLYEKNILAAIHYRPIYQNSYFQKLGFNNDDFPKAESFYSRSISLPLYTEITETQLNYVVKKLHEFYGVKYD